MDDNTNSIPTGRAHLSNKQREQLYADLVQIALNSQKNFRHQAILEYLKTMGFTKSFEALKEETHIEEDAKADGLLEKKWTSVIRLQKKVPYTSCDGSPQTINCCLGRLWIWRLKTKHYWMKCL